MKEKISHPKIAVRTLLKVLLMIVIIFIINSWPSIMRSLDGQAPPFNYWLDHSFKPSNFLLIIGFGAYFYYKDLTDQKDLIAKKQNEIE
ncbi:hypothetical protein ACEN2P_16525 [Pedobacter psychrotolerans]|uniref:hypothetical protein n=1 Tax=Pedobacter psychrotolerans TaxID=1843235 RepID=UPI003F985CA7